MHGYRDGEIKGVGVMWEARDRKKGGDGERHRGRCRDKKVLMSLIYSR